MVNKRTEVVSLRLAPRELRAIWVAARRANRKPSEWMREQLATATNKGKK